MNWFYIYDENIIIKKIIWIENDNILTLSNLWWKLIFIINIYTSLKKRMLNMSLNCKFHTYFWNINIMILLIIITMIFTLWNILLIHCIQFISRFLQYLTKSLINSIYEMMIIIIFHGLINARMRMRFVLSSFIRKIYIIELSLLRITLIDCSWICNLKVGLISWSHLSASYICDLLMSISEMNSLLIIKSEHDNWNASSYYHSRSISEVISHDHEFYI